MRSRRGGERVGGWLIRRGRRVLRDGRGFAAVEHITNDSHGEGAKQRADGVNRNKRRGLDGRRTRHDGDWNWDKLHRTS